MVVLVVERSLAWVFPGDGPMKAPDPTPRRVVGFGLFELVSVSPQMGTGRRRVRLASFALVTKAGELVWVTNLLRCSVLVVVVIDWSAFRHGLHPYFSAFGRSPR
jgi:hypothetical protein